MRRGRVPLKLVLPAGAGSATIAAGGRTERLRIAWPVVAELSEPSVQLLNAAGTPLKADISVSLQDGASKLLRADIRLLSLAAGDCVIEAAGVLNGARVRQLTGIKVTR